MFVEQWGDSFVSVYNPSDNRWQNADLAVAVQAVAWNADGVQWYGTENGLLRIVPSGAKQLFTSADALPDDSITQLALDTAGGLWVGTANGLAYQAPGETAWRNLSDALAYPYISALYPAPDGRVWIGTYPASIGWAKAGQIQSIWTSDDAFPVDLEVVHAITSDAQGHLWIGTDAGAWTMADEETVGWESANDSGGIDQYTTIFSLAAQADGSIWFGTEADGLWGFKSGEGWWQITPHEGLPGWKVYALHAASDGALWVGTNSGIGRYVKP